MSRRQDVARTGAGSVKGHEALPTELVRHLRTNYHQARDLLHQAYQILGKGEEMLQQVYASTTLTTVPQSTPNPSPQPLATPWSQDEAPGHRTPSNGTGSSVETPPLRIQCFGKFQVSRGDQTIEAWNNNRAKGILKLLVIHMGRPIPKDVFIEAFWPGYPAQSANNSFRVAMHELRQRLSLLDRAGDACRYILAQGNSYSLNPQAPLWIDVQEFDAHWRRGRMLEQARRIQEAMVEYQLAARLYQGDFLEEDIYEEWALIRREGLVDVYLTILGKLIDFHIRSGDYETCIDLCQKVLAKDRCREDAYQYLIICYSRLGHRSRALRWYRLCQETLRRELGCSVSPETEALYANLMGSGPENPP